MRKIMEIIAKETGGKSYNTLKYSFESLAMPSFDYDDNEKRFVKWHEKAETISYKKPVDISGLAHDIVGLRPLITYFLDGSRRTYKVDDISYGKRVFPVVAGQIGVGCCRRENGLIHSHLLYRRLVISLPDKANPDSDIGQFKEAYFLARTLKLNEAPELKRLGIQFDKIIPYTTPPSLHSASQSGSRAKLEDLGIARVQEYMIETEKEMVRDLVKKNKLNQNNYLLKDGSLEYKAMKSGQEDLKSLSIIKDHYRWVIGVSKSFNPESILDHTGNPNANYIADLPLYHRTPVALYKNEEFLGDVRFAVWYIRIRDKRYTRTPFDGVIKVEKILSGREECVGIDSDEVDSISANLINERTPTCYGMDSRWANHLYPVFLTESYIKSRYMSTDMFLQLF